VNNKHDEAVKRLTTTDRFMQILHCKNLKYRESFSGRRVGAGWGGVWSPTRSVGARATAERSEGVRGAEGAEKPLLTLIKDLKMVASDCFSLAAELLHRSLGA